MPHEHDDELRFNPTSGLGIGSFAVVGALAVVVVALAHPGGTPGWVAPAAALGGVLAGAALLWPRVTIKGDEIVLRNMLETIHIPLAAVENVAVGQFLAVRAGGRRYVSPAIGRSRGLSIKRPTPGLPRGVNPADMLQSNSKSTLLSTGDAPKVDYADYVQQEIQGRAELARGGGEGSDARVRREPAWLPIGLIAAAALALLVAILL